MNYSKVELDEYGIVLFEKDTRHRVYLCEYGLIHFEWGQHSLVYCPGDFLGLPFIFSSLMQPCDMPCLRGDGCVLDHGDGMVHLTYGSVKIPLTSEECQQMRSASQIVSERLCALKNEGYFSQQKWLKERG